MPELPLADQEDDSSDEEEEADYTPPFQKKFFTFEEMQEEENRDNEAFLIDESLKKYLPKDGEVFAVSHVWNSDPVEAAEEIEVQFLRHMAYMTSLFDKAFSSPQQIDDLKSALTEGRCLVAVWKPATITGHF